MEHESGQLRGKISVADVRLYGLAKSRFLSVKPEMDGDFFRLEIDVEIPKLLIDGDYKAEGSLATFKMGGKGMYEKQMNKLIKFLINCQTQNYYYYYYYFIIFITMKKRSKIEDRKLKKT